ncbi:MAG: hypothetical protein M9916_04350 [Crocinitomicaceae bacterium]|nr:hypothetical protein [Crocinitomicaceae bacterium]
MRFSLIGIVLLVFSCNKKEIFNVQIVGHAGNGLNIQSSVYHANTLESIDLALGLNGVSGVEIDVQLSADNQLWLYHDSKLEVETSTNGCVSEMNGEELRKVKYATVHKEKLVRLAELPFEKYAGKTFYLDVRHYNSCSKVTINQSDFINALNEDLGAINTVDFILITNNTSWLEGFKQQGWKTILNVYEYSELNGIDWNSHSFDGIIIRNSKISKSEVEYIKSKNKEVILFDIRAPKPIRQALKKYPDVVMVDDIKAALIEKK